MTVLEHLDQIIMDLKRRSEQERWEGRRNMHCNPLNNGDEHFGCSAGINEALVQLTRLRKHVAATKN